MKKWILLFFALVLVVNIVAVGIGCKAKAPEKPAVKEEPKPAEPPAAPPAEKPAEKPAEPPAAPKK